MFLKPLRALLVGVVLLLGTVTVSQAQTTASINGIVRDQNGAPLIGATVKAVHVPTGFVYGAITLADGQYNISNMKVGGPYSVEITYVGFRTFTQEGFSLTLGQKLILDAELSEESVTVDEVVISGELDPIMNSTRTGATTSVGEAQIQQLPTLTRSLGDFTRLSPQASATGTGFAGRNGRYNNFTLDGAIVVNAFGLSTDVFPGAGAGTQPISLDAIEELQILIAPYDVRYANFSGAGINAITRSGTNEISASVYSFFRNEGLIGTEVGGIPVSQNEFFENQFGFRVGGPIIKNKLFFFVSGEQTDGERPGVLFRPARDGETGGGSISFARQSTLDSIADFVRTNFNYEPGGTDYAFETKNTKLFARLDYNLSANHKLTLRHSYTDAYTDIPVNEFSNSEYGSRANSLTAVPFENSNYRNNTEINSTVLELNSTFGSKFANNFSATATFIRDFRSSKSAPFPFIEIADGNRQTLTTLGYELFTPNNALDQDGINLTNNFDIYLGKHKVTAGVYLEYLRFANTFNRFFYGKYSFESPQHFYNNWAQFQNDPSVTPASNSRIARYQFGYQIDPERSTTAEVEVLQYALYVQDEWRPNDRLTVTAGLRIDVPTYLTDPFQNDTFRVESSQIADGRTINTSDLPGGNILWSPRVGFNWDVLGNRTLQVRGGSGIFSGRIPYVWMVNNVGNTGATIGEIFADASATGLSTINGVNAYFTPDVAQTRYLPSSTGFQSSNINFADEDYKFPQIWRTNVAVDYRVEPGIILTFEGMYSKDINATFHRNLNLDPFVSTQNGRYQRIVNQPNLDNPASTTRNQLSAFGEVIELTNTNEGEQYFLTFQAQTDLSENFYAMAAYTYTRSFDLTSSTGSSAGSAWSTNPSLNSNEPPVSTSLYENRHRLIASASYKLKYSDYTASQITMFWEYASGSNFSWVYNGDLNNDASNGNDLMYIPVDQNDIVLLPSDASDTRTTQQIWNQLNSFISQDPYLNSKRGSFADRNGARTPAVGRMDLRFLQEFYFKKHTLQFTIDIINFGNLVNRAWGIQKTTVRTNPLRFRGFAAGADGLANTADDVAQFSFDYLNAGSEIPVTQTFINSNSISNRWQLQLGVRYIFN